MGLGRYLLHDFFTAAELNRIEDEQRRSARRRRRSRARQFKKNEAVRQDLERDCLFAFALAELCVEKGVHTRQELRRTMMRLDLADGELDLGMKVADLHRGLIEDAPPSTEPPPA